MKKNLKLSDIVGEIFISGKSNRVMMQPATTVVVAAPQGNGMATAGGVMGIITFVFVLLTPFVGITICVVPITMLLGIIFSHVGLSKSKHVGGMGKGMAVTGLVLNYLTLVGFIALFAMGAAILNEMGL